MRIDRITDGDELGRVYRRSIDGRSTRQWATVVTV
jgi:hypothetical protein